MAARRNRLNLTGHQCRGRWRRTTFRPYTVRGESLSYGRLPDGRWYVSITTDLYGDEARAYPDEQSAITVLLAWAAKLGGEWEQVPCSPHEGWQPGEFPGPVIPPGEPDPPQW